MSDLPQVSNPEQSAANDVVTGEPIVESISDAIAFLSAEQAPTVETVSSAPADIREDDISELHITGESSDVTGDPLDVTEAIAQASQPFTTQPAEPPPSYVKLAMRNMVKKRGTSIKHFVMTTAGLLGLLLGLAYLTR